MPRMVSAFFCAVDVLKVSWYPTALVVVFLPSIVTVKRLEVMP